MNILFGIILIIAAFLNAFTGIQIYREKIEKMNKFNVFMTYICLAIFLLDAGLRMFK